MARSLEEGHRKILVPDTTEVVFEENNGKLVLLAGKYSFSVWPQFLIHEDIVVLFSNFRLSQN